MTEDEVRVLRADFYIALEKGQRAVAHRLAKKLRAATDGAERRRWQCWYRATKRGHRVSVGTFRVEVFAGDDLERLDEARGFLGDDRRVAEAVEQLREAEG